MTKLGILPLYDINGPSSRYRILQFIPKLAEHNIVSKVLPAPQRKLGARLAYLPRLLPLVLWADVLFVQKRILPAFVLSLIHRLRTPIIFDLDDAIYLHQDKQPAINHMLATSNHIIAGNQYLATYSKQHNPHVTILPTVVDTQKYKPAAFTKTHPQQPTVLGWLGMNPNRGDMEMLQPVFNRLAHQFGKQIVLHIISDQPLKMPHNLPQQFKKWTLATSLADLQQIDLGLMPLPDTDWNRGKCGFKILQYMAVGAVAVASPTGVNSEIITDGKDGFLATSEDEWVEKIGTLITQAQLRQQIAQAGLSRIETHYSETAVLPQLVKTIQQTAQLAHRHE